MPQQEQKQKRTKRTRKRIPERVWRTIITTITTIITTTTTTTTTVSSANMPQCQQDHEATTRTWICRNPEEPQNRTDHSSMTTTTTKKTQKVKRGQTARGTLQQYIYLRSDRQLPRSLAFYHHLFRQNVNSPEICYVGRVERKKNRQRCTKSYAPGRNDFRVAFFF